MKPYRNKEPEVSENGGVGWLTTFNDMITLLMVFFVLVFSMSSLDQKKIGHFVNSLQSALGILEEGARVPVGVSGEESPDPTASEHEMEETAEPSLENVANSLKDLDRELGINASFSKKSATITLEEGLLFGSGTAHINPKGEQVLKNIAALLNRMTMPIRIEGHTDNVPIRSGRYPSNWELSTDRAVTVLKYLMDEGNLAPERLSAVGYGASRPAAANDTPENRAKNRRVEIVMVTRNPV